MFRRVLGFLASVFVISRTGTVQLRPSTLAVLLDRTLGDGRRFWCSGRTSSARSRVYDAAALLAIVELVVVTILVVYHERVPLSATPFFFVLAVISLRLRGLKWRDVGFVRPARWLPAIAVGVGAGIAMELFSTFVTVPFLSNFEGKPPDLSDLRPIVGNPLLLLVALVANWVLAAFGEEMVFRAI